MRQRQQIVGRIFLGGQTKAVHTQTQRRVTVNDLSFLRSCLAGGGSILARVDVLFTASVANLGLPELFFLHRVDTSLDDAKSYL